MKLFKAKLIERIERTPTIVSFRFQTEKKVEYLAGQFVQVLFDRKNLENRNLNKYLSFSCSPLNSYFEVTKRLTGSLFSEKLNNLKLGDSLEFKGPMGNYVLDDKFKSLVFIVGGIGITPVIAIIEHIIKAKLNIGVKLFYSNRNNEEIAFFKELNFWQEDKKINVYYTITDCQPKDSRCVYGKINDSLVRKHLVCLEEEMLFIFGPPKMVEAMQKVCENLGCNKDRIKIEKFIGY